MGFRPASLPNKLGTPASTTSFHLSALEGAGLISATRQGRQIIYAVRIVTLRELLVFLTEACCGGRPELCGDISELLPPLPEESPSMTPAFNVLFVCTHNSARSIMAEAILAKVGVDRFRAYSAGSDPARRPMPEVIDKLRALGHDVSGLHCKSWNVFTGPDAPRMDFLITLCDIEERARPARISATGWLPASGRCLIPPSSKAARSSGPPCSTSFMPASTAGL